LRKQIEELQNNQDLHLSENKSRELKEIQNKELIEKEKEEQNKNTIMNRKIKEWKSKPPSDFESNIFTAASQGKLSSIVYILSNFSVSVNSKSRNLEI